MAAGSRVAVAAVHVFVWGIAPLIAADMVPRELTGRAVGSVLMGGSLTLVAGVPLVTLLGQRTSWRFASLAIGGVAVVIAVLLWRFLPRERTVQTRAPERRGSELHWFHTRSM